MRLVHEGIAYIPKEEVEKVLRENDTVSVVAKKLEINLE